MKKIIDFKDNRGVMSLMVILGIGLFVLAITLTLTGQIVVEIIKNRNPVSGDQSFFTAEAAVREGVYRYLSTTTYSGDFDVYPSDINNSTHTISVDNTDLHYAYIAANASNNLTNRIVRYKLEKIPGSMTFSYAIFSDSDITLGGNVDISCVDGLIVTCGGFNSRASIFSNDTMTLNGMAINIDGGAYSGGDMTMNPPHNPNIINGTDDSMSKISYPEIDLQPYRNEAIASSTWFLTSAGANTYLASHGTGTVFVEQDAGTTAIQHKNLDGTLVTRNNLNLSHGTYGTTDFSRAAIIVEGNLNIGANTTINGIVYVRGVTRFFGNGVINGALISLGGAIRSGGTVRVNYNPDISQEFQNMIGLDKTPKIIGWQQE